MLTTLIQTVGLGAGLVALLMLVLWLIHLPMKNASIVDVGWAISISIMALVYALRAPGDPVRSWTIAAMASVWSLRLAVHLVRRIVGEPEEGRYQKLREDWGSNVSLKFLLFFELQAVIAVILSTPILVPTFNRAPSPTILEIGAVVLWVAAIVGESVADSQLKRFKSDPSNRGEVCDVGLWRYSRHPNYFFEWLIWVSFGLFALASPWGWLGLIAPALILFFLLRVTGIPATEAQSLRSRGEKYRRYQERTNAFFPWSPKENR